MPNEKSPIDSKLAQEALNAGHIFTLGHKGTYVAALKDALYAVYEHQDKLKPLPKKGNGSLKLDIQEPEILAKTIRIHRDLQEPNTTNDFPAEYDAAFTSLVKRYQEAKGLPRSGNIAKETKAALLDDLDALSNLSSLDERPIDKKGYAGQKLLGDNNRPIAALPKLEGVTLADASAAQTLPMRPTETRKR